MFIINQKFTFRSEKDIFKIVNTMGFYRLTFSIWTFQSFFLVNSCSESALKSDFNSTNCFFKVEVFLEFSSILLLRGS